MIDYAGQAPPRREYHDIQEPDAGTKSIGDALADVTRDLSVLFQQEVALAKAEFRQTAILPEFRVGNLNQLRVPIAQIGGGELHSGLAGARLRRVGEVPLHPLDL